MQPRLKQRKTKIVSGWLTRDGTRRDGLELGIVTLWAESLDRNRIEKYHPEECWYYNTDSDCTWCEYSQRRWKEKEFKALYTGIPRKGRAIYVEIEIVVD